MRNCDDLWSVVDQLTPTPPATHIQNHPWLIRWGLNQLEKTMKLTLPFSPQRPSLTSKQTQVMSEVKARWLDLIVSPKQTNREAAREAINHFYAANNLSEPEIIWQETLADAYCFVASNREILGVPIVDGYRIDRKYKDLIAEVPDGLKATLIKELVEPILLEALINSDLVDDSVTLSRTERRKMSIRRWLGNAAGDLVGEAKYWASMAGINSYINMPEFAEIDYCHSMSLVEDPWFSALTECARHFCWWWAFEHKVIVVGMPTNFDIQKKEVVRAKLTKRPSLIEALPSILLILFNASVSFALLFFAMKVLVSSASTQELPSKYIRSDIPNEYLVDKD